jgi:hypothetical protein
MMRYFFDIRDGESLTDEYGVEHASSADAMDEAAYAAVGIAQEILVPRGGGTLEIHVRADSQPVGVVTISLDVKKNAAN